MHQLVVVSMALLLGFADVTYAAEHVERVFDHDIATDHFSAGRSVEVDRPVAGDSIAAGAEVALSSNVSGDVILAGGEVRIDGEASQNVYAAGGRVVVDGAVGRNARIAGGRVDIGRRAQIAGNASIAAGRVNVAGNVKGYLQATGGRVYIDGAVGGDVEAAGGEVALGPNARVAGTLRYRSPDALEQDPRAVVSGGIERLAARGPAAPGRASHWVVRWIWTIGLMVLAALLVTALPGFSARVSRRVIKRFLLSMLLAFVAIVCVPIAAIVLLATGIGAPLGILTALAYPGLLLVGYASAGVALGDAILRRAKADHADVKRWRTAFAALGVLAISLAGWIPWVGGFVRLVALLVGVGALISQAWAAASCCPAGSPRTDAAVD
ncbi:polymer-forming cytoskeletal protein [Paraburkholderia sp. IMGN_8]|uniref:polymer-forming cytoskeletal protein n=1 Tax=Paraburkholderia sp. IMGN_8 TaxID=3136564 RepID=UPI0031018176